MGAFRDDNAAVVAAARALMPSPRSQNETTRNPTPPPIAEMARSLALTLPTHSLTQR